ncbi:conserved hypothetical protein [Tenacibaculum sp. 190524A02b]|uniref:Bacteriocin n=1 Tax=Tenacibaculum vairaonense TaxID=3137860 RepID=A0ABP1FBS0_9FLAO
MKKMKLNPLELDKQTIASLNERQLSDVVGGRNSLIKLITTILGGGGGESTGCGSGGSQC